MPNLGIIFPFGFGIGLEIVFATGVPAVTYFELEFGFMGCASPVIEREGDGARLGGPGDEGETVMKAVANNVSQSELGTMTLDEMIAPYKCSDYDAYGEKAGNISTTFSARLQPPRCSPPL